MSAQQNDKTILMLLETESIPEQNEKNSSDLVESGRLHPNTGEQSSGAALRVLHSFLKEVDPHEHWDGLEKTPTEDGNIFWLCEEHARPYRVQPLQTR